MKKLVEGLWDCPYCGSKGIRAGHKICQGCGHPQDENTKFYLPDTITYVSDEEAAKISRNPDWQCSFCGSLNKDDSKFCSSCGALKEDSEKNYFQMRQEQEEKKKQKEINKRKSQTDSNMNEKSSKKSITLPPSSGKEHISDNEKNNRSKPPTVGQSIIRGVLSAGVLGIILFFLISLLLPSIKEVTVQGFKWERSIAVEEQHIYTDDDWNLPSNARLLYTKKELKGYEPVIDHYKTVKETKTRRVFDHYDYKNSYNDLGNGYFDEKTDKVPVYRNETYTDSHKEPVYRQEPVYATRYYYEYDQWDVINHVSSSGKDQKPYWPDISLKNKQRKGKKRESYSVIVKIGDKNKTYTMDQNEWKSLKLGETTKLKVYKFGTATIPKEK